ncbi:MAG TPA: UbiA family prenyltransferase [Labilithrix sp.]|nr:UbiA family prenyltransferase [Labilithrix sp.]
MTEALLASPAKWRTYLRLGRVSNVPTVWSNTLAGMVLAGAPLRPAVFVWLALATSLLYVGGMFLNDAFDRAVDARERPERPIPSGLVTANEVFGVGFGLLAAGIVIAWQVGGVRALGASLALAFAIVLYDAWHKKNVLSPALMGACRVLVYVTAAYAATTEPALAPLLVGAAALFAYLMGLTYVAKQENLERFTNMWPLALLAVPFLLTARNAFEPVSTVLFVGLFVWVVSAVRLLMQGGRGTIPRVVVRLIAGVSLVDALLVAKAGQPLLAAVTASAFFATLFFQRYVKGT